MATEIAANRGPVTRTVTSAPAFRMAVQVQSPDRPPSKWNGDAILVKDTFRPVSLIGVRAGLLLHLEGYPASAYIMYHEYMICVDVGRRSAWPASIDVSLAWSIVACVLCRSALVRRFVGGGKALGNRPIPPYHRQTQSLVTRQVVALLATR